MKIAAIMEQKSFKWIVGGILAIVVVIAIWQRKGGGEQTKPHPHRSIYYGRNKVVKNLFLAKQKKPLFLTRLQDKLEKEVTGKSKTAIRKVLASRVWQIYAEALGQYNTEKATQLMAKLYSLGGSKLKGAIIRGAAKTAGQYNLAFLEQLKGEKEKMEKSELALYYLALLQQYRALQSDKAAYYQRLVEKYLRFDYPMVNFAILRFFAQQDIYNAKIGQFSRQVVQQVFENRRVSPVLLSSAAQILFKHERKYMQQQHRALLTKPQDIYIRFYISTLHLSCYLDIPFLQQLLSDKDLSFSIFRPLVAELMFIGGKKVKHLLHQLSQLRLGEQKRQQLERALAKISRDKSRVCPQI